MRIDSLQISGLSGVRKAENGVQDIRARVNVDLALKFGSKMRRRVTQGKRESIFVRTEQTEG